MISIVCERIPKISPSPLANFKLVMIDEWQDTSESQVLQTVNDIYSIFYPLVAQLELVKLFAKCTKGISVVGGRFCFCLQKASVSIFLFSDPHQSIYAFRGACFANWKRLADMLSPQVVFLSTNYRSTSVVSSVCQALISYNPAPKLGDAVPQPVLTVRPEKDPVKESLLLSTFLLMLCRCK